MLAVIVKSYAACLLACLLDFGLIIKNVFFLLNHIEERQTADYLYDRSFVYVIVVFDFGFEIALF